MRLIIGKNIINSEDKFSRSFRAVVEQPRPTRGLFKTCLISAAVGTIVGVGYAFQKINRDRKNLELEGSEIPVNILKYKPTFETSRKVLKKSYKLPLFIFF